MKKKMALIGQYLFIVLLFFAGCRKEKKDGTGTPGPVLPKGKHAPTARIDNDTTRAVLECASLSGKVILNGSTSSDEDSDIVSYEWRQISGPSAIHFESPTKVFTVVDSLIAGNYIVELTVKDKAGMASKDSAWIIVTSSSYEYNIDADLQSTFVFYDNMEICPWDCYIADEMSIIASSQFSNSEIMQVAISEETDSAVQAYHVSNGYTGFRLSNRLYAGGVSSFNLKQVMLQGGGSFNGNIQLSSSSALGTCREDAFKALAPLRVTGNLNVATRAVNMHITGKIIF
ncbi:MAG TPA: hypothetical protein VNT20_16480 [Flavisolibacter sp.]|jgi:hypothetical protein|nr:hypothetical protein [Flavisolibacter sp.]